MSFIPVSGILYANENFDAESEVVMTAEDAIAPDESDTLAAAVSEITDNEASINQSEAQLTSAEVAADGLEEIAEKVEEANEAGGIDETTAEIVETAVESILKTARIGITTKQMGLPSTEGFRVKNNRVALGQSTVESIKQTASKIWKAIVDAVKRSIAWVKEFFRKLFSVAERIIKRSDALTEKVRGLGAKKAKEAKFKNASLYKSLAIESNLADLGTIEKTGGTLKAVIEHHDNVVKKLTEGIEKEDVNAADALNSSSAAFKEAPENIKKQIDASTDVAVAYTGIMPGNVTVFMTSPKNDSVDSNAIRAGKLNLSAKLEGKEEIQVLSQDDINKAAGIAKGLAVTVNEFKKNLSEAEKTKLKAISIMEKAANDDSDDDAKKKKLEKAKVLRRLINEPSVSAASIGLSVAKATLELGELSARQYTEDA